MPNWLKQRASLTPDRTAFETSEQRISFLKLWDRVLGLTGKLTSLGIQKGDHVALLSENSLDLVCFFHALMALGAVGVPLNIRLSPEELAWETEDSEARWLICDDACQPLEPEIMKETRSFNWITMNHVKQQPQANITLQHSFHLDDPCTIIYTSGTTGRPKGVVLTYGNHWWSATGSALNLGLADTDKWLCCVPLFHVSGLSIIMKNIIYGMPVFLLKRFDPHAANRVICQNGVSMVSVVANMLRRMLDDLGTGRYPAAFRCMLLGGGPAPLPLLQHSREKKIPVYQTYGLTETASQMVTLPPEFMFSKLGSAGKPLFQGEIRIVGEDRETKKDEPGEILVRGMNVTLGYWNRPGATAKAFSNGWLHTGDIGYLDSDGFLYVLDRRDDLIISGGENVYPAEVESVLLAFPGVEEAGVIGVKNQHWGEVPFAFIHLKPGCSVTEEALLAFCEKKLARYKLPVGICFTGLLPRNASRKLLRRKLADRLPEEYCPSK